MWALIDWLCRILISQNPFFDHGQELYWHESYFEKGKNDFWMMFLLDKLRLVQIRGEMAIGDKTCQWMSLLVHFSLINQTINQKSECPEYASEIGAAFAPKRFYFSLSVFICIWHFFFDSKQKNWKFKFRKHQEVINHLKLFRRKNFKKFFGSGGKSLGAVKHSVKWGISAHRHACIIKYYCTEKLAFIFPH